MRAERRIASVAESALDMPAAGLMPGAGLDPAEGTRTCLRADFCELSAVLDELKIDFADAVMLDLGLSSDQLVADERGFSFDATGPLDMRFNPEADEPAWKLLERLPERDLADLIYQFGEERF